MPAGAPLGNQNGAKGRPIAAALQRALARLEADGDYRTINAVAEKIITMAIDGDIEAIKVLCDRLDGKPQQALDVTTRRVEGVHQAQALDIAQSFIESSKRAQLRTGTGNVIDIVPKDAEPPSE